MKIQAVTNYQTEDGQKFATMGEAEQHMDVLDLSKEIMDECHLPEQDAINLAEWLYENYEITPWKFPAQD